jgi:hypothetical protein
LFDRPHQGGVIGVVASQGLNRVTDPTGTTVDEFNAGRLESLHNVGRGAFTRLNRTGFNLYEGAAGYAGTLR